jgi:regulator of replication initiation timing
LLPPLLWSAWGARADEVLEARMRDQLKEAVTQVRQLQIENASLKADLAKATAATPAPAAAAAPADASGSEELQSSLDQQTTRADALETQTAQLKKTLSQWQQSYDQATALARDRDAAAKKSEALSQDLRTHVDTCEKNNATLVSISEELLSRYKNKGVIAAARDREPLLGLHRVELERLAQEYHARIVDTTTTPFDPEAPPAPTDQRAAPAPAADGAAQPPAAAPSQQSNR